MEVDVAGRMVLKMAKKELYKYGMGHRGFSIGCQPKKGFVERVDDPRGRYYDIIIYDRMLTGDEVSDYELTYLGKVE